MTNHPNRRRHVYHVHAKMVGREPIVWETPHAQTAYRWYDEMLRTHRPCDGGSGIVMGVTLYRDEQLVRETMIGQGR